jgi:hypothetical protein
MLPATTQHESHEENLLRNCQGIPACSYFLVPRNVKHALAFTRPAIEHFTGLTNEEIIHQLCKLFHNPDQIGFDCMFTLILRCGHEVCVQPNRACAANCSDTPESKSKIFPDNNKQDDVILCHECVYDAEMVYERYAQSVLGPENACDAPQPAVRPTYGFADLVAGNNHEYPPADGLPAIWLPEQDILTADFGARAS